MYISIQIIILFLMCSAVAFAKWIELGKNNRLRKLIAWSVADKSSALSCESTTSTLTHCLFNAQVSLDVDRKYRLFQEDAASVREIINAFRDNLARSYFSGNVIAAIPSGEKEEEEYFFLALYVFICESRCTWNESVFFKLKFISCKYCRNSEHLKKYVPSWAEDNIKQDLENLICGG